MHKVITRGIVRILPMALSLWIFWSISVGLNDIGLAMLGLVGIHEPWQAAGFLVVFGLLLVVGLAFSVSPIFWLYQKLEAQVLRFPLFKTVHGAIKDMASLVISDAKTPHHRQTVLVKQANDSYVVGFVTAAAVPIPVSEVLTESYPTEEWVPVLMQLSYQIAGVTTLVKKSDLIYVDWPFEDAMRFMLTAGISQTEPSPVKPGR